MTCRRGLVLVLAALFSVSVLAQSPEALLQNMGQAFRSLNYSGVFTHEYGSDIQTLAIKHVLIDDKEYEKLTTLNGKEATVIRSGHALHCVHIGASLLEPRAGSSLALGLNGLVASPEKTILNFYTVRDLGLARVAGRRVQAILLQPKDTLRNALQLYIDTETGLTLKRIVISPEARVLERLQFTSLNLAPSINAHEFESSLTSNLPHPLQMNTTIKAQSGIDIAPAWLPPGFVLAAGGQYTKTAKMLLYSDGLSAFSIVLEPNFHVKTRMEGKARYGATVAVTRPIAIDGQHYILTVMGDVPLITAARVARHIALSQSG